MGKKEILRMNSSLFHFLSFGPLFLTEIISRMKPLEFELSKKCKNDQGTADSEYLCFTGGKELLEFEFQDVRFFLSLGSS